MILIVYLVQIQLIVSNVKIVILCLTIKVAVNKIKIKLSLILYKIFKVIFHISIIIQLKKNVFHA